jgi:hypothetical protein
MTSIDPLTLEVADVTAAGVAPDGSGSHRLVSGAGREAHVA